MQFLWRPGWRRAVAKCLLSAAAGCGLFAAGAAWEHWNDTRLESRQAGRGAASSPAGQPGAVLPPPGEFSRQTALLLGCNELIRFHPGAFCEIVAAARGSVPLVLLVSSEQEHQRGLELLRQAGIDNQGICFIIMPIDTMWVRDYGPLFRQQSDGSAFVADLDYLPLEKPTEDRRRDDDAPQLLAKVFATPARKVPLRLNGGNMLTNGDGLCVTTTAAIENNPELGRDPARIGPVLTGQLGFRRWVYVRPLAAESTGDVDMMMTFVAPDAAVVGRLDPADDPTNAAILDEAAAGLAKVQTSRGPMKVHRIPLPPQQQGLWRSYTNVVFANGTLLVPRFRTVNPRLQEEAMSLYARLLPDWRIVGIEADSLAGKQGVLHCISRDVPGFVSLDNVLALINGRGTTRGASAAPTPGDFMPLGPALPDQLRLLPRQGG